MHGGLGHERNVRPSVCPSVKRVNCEKIKETYAQIFIPYKRIFHLVFCDEEWLAGCCVV